MEFTGELAEISEQANQVIVSIDSGTAENLKCLTDLKIHVKWQREQLRYSVRILSELDMFWAQVRAIGISPSSPSITKGQYIGLHLSLARSMWDNFDFEETYNILSDDYDLLTKEDAGLMSHSTFQSQLFDIVDLWLVGARIETYLRMFRILFEHMTYSDYDRAYCMKELEYIKPFSCAVRAQINVRANGQVSLSKQFDTMWNAVHDMALKDTNTVEQEGNDPEKMGKVDHQARRHGQPISAVAELDPKRIISQSTNRNSSVLEHLSNSNSIMSPLILAPAPIPVNLRQLSKVEALFPLHDSFPVPETNLGLDSSSDPEESQLFADSSLETDWKAGNNSTFQESLQIDHEAQAIAEYDMKQREHKDWFSISSAMYLLPSDIFKRLAMYPCYAKRQSLLYIKWNTIDSSLDEQRKRLLARKRAMKAFRRIKKKILDLFSFRAFDFHQEMVKDGLGYCKYPRALYPEQHQQYLDATVSKRKQLRHDEKMIEILDKFWYVFPKNGISGYVNKDQYIYFWLMVHKCLLPHFHEHDSHLLDLIDSNWVHDRKVRLDLMTEEFQTKQTQMQQAVDLLASRRAYETFSAGHSSLRKTTKFPSKWSKWGGHKVRRWHADDEEELTEVEMKMQIQTQQEAHVGMTKEQFFDTLFELSDMWCSTTELEDYCLFLNSLFTRIAARVKTAKMLAEAKQRRNKIIEAQTVGNDHSEKTERQKKIDRLLRRQAEAVVLWQDRQAEQDESNYKYVWKALDEVPEYEIITFSFVDPVSKKTKSKESISGFASDAFLVLTRSIPHVEREHILNVKWSAYARFEKNRQMAGSKVKALSRKLEGIELKNTLRQMRVELEEKKAKLSSAEQRAFLTREYVAMKTRLEEQWQQEKDRLRRDLAQTKTLVRRYSSFSRHYRFVRNEELGENLGEHLRQTIIEAIPEGDEGNGFALDNIKIDDQHANAIHRKPSRWNKAKQDRRERLERAIGVKISDANKAPRQTVNQIGAGEALWNKFNMAQQTKTKGKLNQKQRDLLGSLASGNKKKKKRRKGANKKFGRRRKKINRRAITGAQRKNKASISDRVKSEKSNAGLQFKTLAQKVTAPATKLNSLFDLAWLQILETRELAYGGMRDSLFPHNCVWNGTVSRPFVHSMATRLTSILRHLQLQDIELQQLQRLFSITDCFGRTVLHIAVILRDFRAVVTLVELGCEINIRDIYNRNPVDYALRLGCMKMLDLFLGFGFDLTLSDGIRYMFTRSFGVPLNHGLKALRLLLKHCPPSPNSIQMTELLITLRRHHLEKETLRTILFSLQTDPCIRDFLQMKAGITSDVQDQDHLGLTFGNHNKSIQDKLDEQVVEAIIERIGKQQNDEHYRAPPKESLISTLRARRARRQVPLPHKFVVQASSDQNQQSHDLLLTEEPVQVVTKNQRKNRLSFEYVNAVICSSQSQTQSNVEDTDEGNGRKVVSIHATRQNSIDTSGNLKTESGVSIGHNSELDVAGKRAIRDISTDSAPTTVPVAVIVALTAHIEDDVNVDSAADVQSDNNTDINADTDRDDDDVDASVKNANDEVDVNVNVNVIGDVGPQASDNADLGTDTGTSARPRVALGAGGNQGTIEGAHSAESLNYYRMRVDSEIEPRASLSDSRNEEVDSKTLLGKGSIHISIEPSNKTHPKNLSHHMQRPPDHLKSIGSFVSSAIEPSPIVDSEAKDVRLSSSLGLHAFPSTQETFEAKENRDKPFRFDGSQASAPDVTFVKSRIDEEECGIQVVANKKEDNVPKHDSFKNDDDLELTKDPHDKIQSIDRYLDGSALNKQKEEVSDIGDAMRETVAVDSEPSRLLDQASYLAMDIESSGNETNLNGVCENSDMLHAGITMTTSSTVSSLAIPSSLNERTGEGEAESSTKTGSKSKNKRGQAVIDQKIDHAFQHVDENQDTGSHSQFRDNEVQDEENEEAVQASNRRNSWFDLLNEEFKAGHFTRSASEQLDPWDIEGELQPPPMEDCPHQSNIDTSEPVDEVIETSHSTQPVHFKEELQQVCNQERYRQIVLKEKQELEEKKRRQRDEMRRLLELAASKAAEARRLSVTKFQKRSVSTKTYDKNKNLVSMHTAELESTKDPSIFEIPEEDHIDEGLLEDTPGQLCVRPAPLNQSPRNRAILKRKSLSVVDKIPQAERWELAHEHLNWDNQYFTSPARLAALHKTPALHKNKVELKIGIHHESKHFPQNNIHTSPMSHKEQGKQHIQVPRQISRSELVRLQEAYLFPSTPSVLPELGTESSINTQRSIAELSRYIRSPFDQKSLSSRIRPATTPASVAAFTSDMIVLNVATPWHSSKSKITLSSSQPKVTSHSHRLLKAPSSPSRYSSPTNASSLRAKRLKFISPQQTQDQEIENRSRRTSGPITVPVDSCLHDAPVTQNTDYATTDAITWLSPSGAMVDTPELTRPPSMAGGGFHFRGISPAESYRKGSKGSPRKSWLFSPKIRSPRKQSTNSPEIQYRKNTSSFQLGYIHRRDYLQHGDRNHQRAKSIELFRGNGAGIIIPDAGIRNLPRHCAFAFPEKTDARPKHVVRQSRSRWRDFKMY